MQMTKISGFNLGFNRFDGPVRPAMRQASPSPSPAPSGGPDAGTPAPSPVQMDYPVFFTPPPQYAYPVDVVTPAPAPEPNLPSKLLVPAIGIGLAGLIVGYMLWKE